MATLIDYYPETGGNPNSYFPLVRTGSQINYVGQAFLNPNVITLDSVKFYLSKLGTPTGTIDAKVYASTGTLNTDAKPTGSSLATSEILSIADLGAAALSTFNFTGANRITLDANTNYIVVVHSSFTSGDSTNNLVRAWLDDTSPGHAGNSSYSVNGSTWYAYNLSDQIFYVYGNPVTNTGNFFSIL